MFHAIICFTEAGLERGVLKENIKERWPTPANEEIEPKIEITIPFLQRTGVIERIQKRKHYRIQ